MEFIEKYSGSHSLSNQWNLTSLDEESLEMATLEAGKQLTAMLDLVEEAEHQIA